ncbi:MAG: hypothetical protein H7235_03845 [Bdellovibrionaceae bacterium]|nr:hypothetical protein [Pseudobdellovibrionaceae bacterium]
MQTMSTAIQKKIISTAFITLIILATSCGQVKKATGPAIDETGDEIANRIPDNNFNSN